VYTGAQELSESCVSQNSGSLETEQPCVEAQGGGSEVLYPPPPEKFLQLVGKSALWTISWP